MKVLLINPNNSLDKILGNAKIFAKPDVPLGITYIGAYLRKMGHHVMFRDSYFWNDDCDDVIRYIARKQPDIIGVSCLTANGKYVYRLCKEVKKRFPNILICLGNIHASVFSDFYLKNNAADIVSHGEGEHAMLEICNTFQKQGTFENIKGISWKHDGRIIDNEPRDFIKNLDHLPFPYMEDINYHDYPRLKTYKEPYIPIFSSRGCVNKCTFCAVHGGQKYRARTAGNVIEEIEFYLKRYKIDRFVFEDPLFIANRERISEFCDLLREKKLKIKWGGEGHVNCISEPLLRKMAAHGCESLAFGIESGNQNILKMVRKNTKIKDIKEKIKLAAQYIPNVAGLFIIGLPGDTYGTIMETIQFSLELPLNSVQFSMFTPYPGSELYAKLSNEGKIKVNMDDLEGLINSWERYSSYAIFADDAPKPIYIADGLSLNELKQLHKKALRKFYFRLKYLLKNTPPHLLTLNFKDSLMLLKSVIKLAA